jgi:hypothetical protein
MMVLAPLAGVPADELRQRIEKTYGSLSEEHELGCADSDPAFAALNARFPAVKRWIPPARR